MNATEVGWLLVAVLLALWLAGSVVERRRRRPVPDAGARHLASRLRANDPPALGRGRHPRVTVDLERLS